MTEQTTGRTASRGGIVAAFAAVYVIWGSTYLAIRFAIETLPPFLMAGTRFVIAGALLYGWLRWRGVPRPARGHWGPAAVAGGLLLLGGNGLVVWAEQWVPSGVAALLVATVPLLFVRDPSGRYLRNLGFPGIVERVLEHRCGGFPDLRIAGMSDCYGVWGWNGSEYAHLRNEAQTPGACDHLPR